MEAWSLHCRKSWCAQACGHHFAPRASCRDWRHRTDSRRFSELVGTPREGRQARSDLQSVRRGPSPVDVRRPLQDVDPIDPDCPGSSEAPPKAASVGDWYDLDGTDVDDHETTVRGLRGRSPPAFASFTGRGCQGSDEGIVKTGHSVWWRARFRMRRQRPPASMARGALRDEAFSCVTEARCR